MPNVKFGATIDRRLVLAGVIGSVLPGAPNAQPLLGPTDTVALEHSDRVERIRRATNRLQVRPAPEFSTTVVPSVRMPSVFRVDTPVLRVRFSERTFFDTAESRLLASGSLVVRAIAEAMRGEAPDVAVFVAGHTDSRGGEAYNHDLSVARSNSVAAALLYEGIGEIALWRVGFGEAVPLYPNDTLEHMAFNRRVEFLFAGRTEAVMDVLSASDENPCAAPSEAGTSRCLNVESREEYIVFRESRSPVQIGTDGAAARAAGGAPRRPASGQPRTGSAVAGEPAVRVTSGAPDRLVIGLRERSYTIPAPIR